ncbi:MAG TPA: DNA/RNA nuclease SfsA [Syntrophomonadaceae bacterium]|nr:DNA/RNA nuclease SfsA [Syntrophomonadaceae bacterium]HRX20144.1 DNA/RNA nuclease SfsA [Syntrophomonadaceae bacterium]
MQYHNVRTGKFIFRPNRFIAHIEIDGREEICHVKNTGRCKELLVPGANIVVQEAVSEKRRTKFDLLGVYKGERLVNIDSQIPNKVFHEWIETSNFFPELSYIKPEYTYRDSRLDFYMEAGNRKILTEVKGVTLENDGVALFPDAPTERGIKHVNDLCHAVSEGFEAYLFFIIQMKDVLYFTPNRDTHPAFAEAVKKAVLQGVKVIALDCMVTANSITARDFVSIRIPA